MRGELTQEIRTHILGREGEWIVDDICEHFPGVKSITVSVVVNNMLARWMIARTGSARSRTNRVVACYMTVGDEEDRIILTPSEVSARWKKLMGKARFEDVRLKPMVYR